jgi:hypothetical protein
MADMGAIWPEADLLLSGCYAAKRTLTLSTRFNLRN